MNTNDTAIAKTEGSQAASAETFMPLMKVRQAIVRYDAVLTFTQQIMKQGKDFGVIPGVDRPSLLKPGAEKLCSFFGLTPKFPIIKATEEWEDPEPFFYYLYKCELWRGNILIAEGDGSCNSRETKYRYRWVGAENLPDGMDAAKLPKRSGNVVEMTFAVDKAETTGKYGKPASYWQAFRDAIASGEARKVQKTVASGKTYDAWEIESTVYRVANTDVADQVNTIQKMAQKRALIAATLIACNASEYYTQDVEDMNIIGDYPKSAARSAAVVDNDTSTPLTGPKKDLPSEEATRAAGDAAGDAASEEVPVIVQQAWAKMVSMKASIDTFGIVKDLLYKAMGTEVGDQEYYRILSQHGVEHANGFKRLEPARQAVRDMLMVVEDATKAAANV